MRVWQTPQPLPHTSGDTLLSRHYDGIALTFEQHWTYSPEFLRWMTSVHLYQRGVRTDRQRVPHGGHRKAGGTGNWLIATVNGSWRSSK